MAKDFLSVRVELVYGAPAGELWPPPGRVLAVGPHHTFEDLAAAIDEAFARWDRNHLWEFTLADGRRIGAPDTDDDPDEEDAPLNDAARTRVADAVAQGSAFRYEFDVADRWVHRCTVDRVAVDPLDDLGLRPPRPLPYAGWGAIPDQYGRRWADDDGGSPEPARPEEPDPMLAPGWPGASSPPRALHPRELPDLRGATARRDRDAVRALLVDRDPGPLLQHAGDALLAVGLDGFEDVAREVERRLRARDDAGDAELADALAGRLSAAPPMLRPVPVDLDGVAELMSGDPRQDRGGWIDLHTGETWPTEVLDAVDDGIRPDIDGQPERWLHVRCEGSRETWLDRRDFAAGLRPGRLRDRLLDALEGRGAFGRFSRVLDDEPDVLTEWRAFGAERERGRARALLAAEGCTVSAAPG